MSNQQSEPYRRSPTPPFAEGTDTLAPRLAKFGAAAIKDKVFSDKNTLDILATMTDQMGLGSQLPPPPKKPTGERKPTPVSQRGSPAQSQKGANSGSSDMHSIVGSLGELKRSIDTVKVQSDISKEQLGSLIKQEKEREENTIKSLNYLTDEVEKNQYRLEVVEGKLDTVIALLQKKLVGKKKPDDREQEGSHDGGASPVVSAYEDGGGESRAPSPQQEVPDNEEGGYIWRD